MMRVPNDVRFLSQGVNRGILNKSLPLFATPYVVATDEENPIFFVSSACSER